MQLDMSHQPFDCGVEYVNVFFQAFFVVIWLWGGGGVAKGG